MPNVSKYQKKEESASTGRKRAKKGVNPVPVSIGVLSVVSSMPLLFRLKRRYRLSEGSLLLLLSMVLYDRISVSRLVLLHYGVKSGADLRGFQRRLLTLERKGLVTRVGIHWSISEKAMIAIREIDAGIGQSGEK